MNKLYKLSSTNIINLIFIKELYIIWKNKINIIFIGCANRWWKKRPVSTSVNVAAWRAKKSIDHVGRRPGFPNPVFILRSYHITESDVKQRILRFSKKKKKKRDHCQRTSDISAKRVVFIQPTTVSECFPS